MKVKTIFGVFWLFGLSVFDVRYRKVPIWLLTVGGVAAAAFLACKGIAGEGFEEYLCGLLPGGMLLLIAAGTKRAGWADGLMLMILGALLGLGGCVMIMTVSLFLISIFSVILLVFRKVNRNTRLPYAPFLAIADLLWLMMET